MTTTTHTLSDLEVALLNSTLANTVLAQPASRSIDGITGVSAQVRTSEWRGQQPRWQEPQYIEVVYHIGESESHHAFIPLRGIGLDERGGVRLDAAPEAMDPSGSYVEVLTTAGHRLRALCEIYGGWSVTIKAPRNR